MDSEGQDEKVKRPSRLLRLPLRAGVVFVGATITLFGIIIIPIPGPWGTPFILLGMGLLGSEIPAVRRFNEKVKAKLLAGKNKNKP